MIKKTKKVETEAPKDTPKEKSPQGRQELYFFPNYLRNISAGSIQEARQKLKEGEK